MKVRLLLATVLILTQCVIGKTPGKLSPRDSGTRHCVTGWLLPK